MYDVAVGIAVASDTALGLSTVQSVLQQCGVEAEVIVVGDATQLTGMGSESPNVRHIHRRRPPTRVEMLRLLARESNAPFILSLKSHKQLLPGALAKLVGKLKQSPELGMVHCLHFATDDDGHTSRHAYHDVWQRAHKLSGFRTATLRDYLSWDFLLDGIRVYRRALLEAPDLLAAQSRFASDYCMLWTLMTKLEFELVPEPLCLSKGSLPINDLRRIDLRDYLHRVAALFKLRKIIDAGRQDLQFGSGEIATKALKYLWRRSRLRRAGRKKWEKFRRWSLASGLTALCYKSVVRLLAGWPLPGSARATGDNGRPKRIAYYIWQFPVASQTFVQREVAGLLRAATDVLVISQIEADDGYIAKLEPALSRIARCLSTLDDEQIRDHRRRFFRRDPVRYLGLFAYVVGQRYHAIKHLRFDRSVFSQAIALAALAEEHAIKHLHSPWADNCAFVALIAARLLGIPFSIQARAHDIHRHDYKFGLFEKSQNAEFVITNTEYNVKQIRRLLSEKDSSRVKLIYNGLNLEQFEPVAKAANNRAVVNLLCVARLIEQKGLTHLLSACRGLLDSGLRIQCTIVGGTEDLFMNYYIELKRLHRQLQLEPFVHFTGSKPFSEVLDYYRSADIFVLPCVLGRDGSRDIIPNSVLEAMAMKLPVVSTTVTGVPELVDHEQNGLLVTPGDELALARAIQTLASDPFLRVQFGENGRQKIEARFDTSKNAGHFRSLFLTLDRQESVGIDTPSERGVFA